MKITRGRLKQIIKEEVESYVAQPSVTEEVSVDDVKGKLADIAQGLLQDPPQFNYDDDSLGDLSSALLALKGTPEQDEEPMPDLGGMDE